MNYLSSAPQKKEVIVVKSCQCLLSTMATSSFVYFSIFVFFIVVIMAGAVVISRFAGAIQQEQASTETKWEAADRMEEARLREDKNRMAGGK